MSTTLGLDLGPNSIGWALVNENRKQIIDMGVRIFPEGVDNFDSGKEESRNEARRSARMSRRQVARRAKRKRRLREALIEANLWPADCSEQQALEAIDPYELRARAVDETAPRLSRHELGRVILHLNQRRGFFSHRKDQTRDKETQGMLAEMSVLEQTLAGRTLGQFLHEKTASLDPVERREDDHVRRRHTRRHMLEHELLRIASRHPDVLTDDLLFGRIGRQPLNPAKPRRRSGDLSGLSQLQAFGVHGIMFFQRPIYWPKSRIGLCELEPKQPRCPRADRVAQRFRMLQEVNNLRYIDADANEEKSLTADQRQLLLEKLAVKKEMKFNGPSGIKATLGFLETIRFNLERGERSGLKGHITDHQMAGAVGKRWHKCSEQDKDRIVRVLLDPSRDDETARPLLLSLGLSDDEAEAALGVDFPQGYVNLSVKAIERLLPHMERGLVYQMTDPTNSAVHAAGYMRPDELQRRIFDVLPDLTRTSDAPIGDIPNPVVRRTLVELRKLVNAIIRNYGKPDAIHVEMAREVKQGEKQRSQYNKRIREREAEREAAADKLRENNVKVTRSAINRYLLWLEQDRLCVYTGKPISCAQLYNGDADVDHILPYSRSLDDSMMNKVVCFRDANHEKGRRTPYEWLASQTPNRYDQLCQRARKLPYVKYRRFLQKELELDKFIARQLVDTSYIARATGEYLRCLFDGEQRHRAVLGIKGQLTAELRHQWGLNDLLNPSAIDVKSRDDHRHHAVDALVVALTDRSRLQHLTRIRKAGGMQNTGEVVPYPWEQFREDVEQRVNAIHVSHRAERKVAGALHEESIYGLNRDDRGNVVNGEFVIRKRLEALSPNEVELIRDQAVRKVITQRLAEHGVEVGRGMKVSPAIWKQALCDPANPVRIVSKKGSLGAPIYKVRVIRREQTIQPIRDDGRTAYVKPGSTHHISIFSIGQNGDGKKVACWTTMLEASRRVARRQQRLAEIRKQLESQLGRKIRPRDPVLSKEMCRVAREIPLITQRHPDYPDAKFQFSLSRGEMVLAKVNGKQELLVYNTSASTQGQIYFYHHADARPKSGRDKAQVRKKFTFTANTLDARKVTVDYLGRIRWAND